ncbi:hypothetical protein [Streptomyces albipurpureus]|uniref:Uncharacterized protein n=1 Tax=Streptomyces albipurpureus TaxID=2897419 RepID=A0ABT0UZP0_9ACTN|nr:hypothetical protein [Streptomyces sp. CWNU-1]MCM2393945.1 hypothetical protein [Streptomyces sp. CWNU-1]
MADQEQQLGSVDCGAELEGAATEIDSAVLHFLRERVREVNEEHELWRLP